MSSRIPLAPGTILGRYQVLALAGEGGMGDIYKAVDTSLERTVALKRIRSGFPDDSTQERFRREALALAQLNHPGICQVYEMAATNRGTFLVLEWVEGETLADRLRRGPLPWREAAGILRQVAEALIAAHAKNLVHRDLKPSNLMLTGDGRAKILDFGLVRFADQSEESGGLPDGVTMADFAASGERTTLAGGLASGSGRALTRVGSFMGTLGYTSPEQALARPVGPPSDLFSLGIVAHEMVAGERPFAGEGRAALDAVVDNQREPLRRDQGSKAYRALVDRLLAPKQKDRPTAAEAAAILSDMLSPLGALWWSGLSAALVLILGSAGLWLYSRGILAGLVKGRPARVAVMGFRNETGQPALSAQTELGLADLVSAALRRSPKLQVLDADALAQAAGALKLNPAQASQADQQRLARALGADLVLSGEVRRQDGADLLHFRLDDAKGRTRSEGEVKTASISDLTLSGSPLSGETARRLMKAVDPLARAAQGGSREIPPQAFAAYAQGVEAYRRGHFKEAEPALATAAYADPEWSNAATVYAMDLMHLSRPETDAALRWALVAARKESNGYLESTLLQSFAKLALRRQDPAASSGYYEQGLAQARSSHDFQSTAFCLNGLGLIEVLQKRPEEAMKRYTEALAAADQVGDLFMQAQIQANLGNLALERGDLAEAASRYRAVVDVAHRAGTESGEALGLNNLGIALLSSFKVAEARPILERALALREKNGEALGAVSSHRNLGICAQMEGRPDLARAEFQASLDKALAISSAYGEGQARFYLAECDRRAGQWPKARAAYAEAARASEATHDTTRLGQELAAEAECLLHLRENGPAAPLLLRSESLAPGNPYLLRAQAWAASLGKDQAKALDLLDQAIRDPRHDAPEIRSELEQLRSRFQAPASLR